MFQHVLCLCYYPCFYRSINLGSFDKTGINTMKVILYMAITANGLIAREDDDASWVTKTEWKSFSGMIRKHGNMIVGRRTHEIMVKSGEFTRSKLDKVNTVVVTHQPLTIHDSRYVSIATSPRQALTILKQKGHKTALLCGGGRLNASVMKEKLVDEIYLDIEPIVLGKGIKLFAEVDFETRLELQGVKRLSPNEVQLWYKVRKR